LGQNKCTQPAYTYRHTELVCRKVILIIMKSLDVNATLLKSSNCIHTSTLICCLFDRDFALLIFWTRDLTLYIYTYI